MIWLVVVAPAIVPVEHLLPVVLSCVSFLCLALRKAHVAPSKWMDTAALKTDGSDEHLLLVKASS